MKIAIDIAEQFAPALFAAIAATPVVKSAAAKLLAHAGPDVLLHPAGHVIDTAGYGPDPGEVVFDGEFDFHVGLLGGEPGHPGLRVNVTGTLRDGEPEWRMASLSIESVELVDGADAPDRLPAPMD